MLMELDLNRFIPTIAVNSLILAGTSFAATLIIERLLARRTTASSAVVGVLTGLAAATACSAFLEPVTAAVTGLLAGTIAGAFSVAKRPAGLTLAGVIAVTNLVGGTTGLLMTGLLEPSRGFFYSGSVALPVAQVTAVIVCVVYCTLVCVPLGLVIGGRHRKRTVSASPAAAVTGTEKALPGL
jgi:Amt family ammonium transporter